MLKMHSTVSGNHHCKKTKRIQSENVNGEEWNNEIYPIHPKKTRKQK